MFVNTAPKAVRELAAWGVPWSRDPQGRPRRHHQRPEGHDHRARRGPRPDRAARLRRHQEVAHLLRVRRHGHAMINAVADRAIAESIPVHERNEALALIHDGGRCYGAVVSDLVTGELSAYVAKATAIATGGAGRIYQRHHQRGHLRGHRPRDRARDRRRGAWQHGSGAVPPDRDLSRRASSSPRAAAATGGC